MNQEAEEVLAMARSEMDQAVSAFRHELSRVRTGRASTALLEGLQVNYYGTKTPLRQLAGLSAPEPRLLVVTPYDKGAMHEIQKAIQTSDLGLNPMNDGKLIRIPIPELNEERLKDLHKDKKVADDDLRTAETKIQQFTTEFIEKVDGALAAKEAEIMEV